MGKKYVVVYGNSSKNETKMSEVFTNWHKARTFAKERMAEEDVYSVADLISMDTKGFVQTDDGHYCFIQEM